MGERKCALDGCNALEFRTTGYCLRHKGGLSEGSPNVTGDPLEKGSNVGAEGILFIIGIPISIFGFRLLQAEPVTHWFENLINPIVQVCGVISLVVGLILIFSPLFAKYGYRFEKSHTPEFSLDPTTGMYYLPNNQDSPEGQHTSEE